MHATRVAASPPGGSTHRRSTPHSRIALTSERPLHVLDVTDFYSETASGGVKTYLEAKAHALAALGVKHTVVVPGAVSGTTSMGPSRVHTIAARPIPMAPAYRAWLSGAPLRSVVERERPDVVEVGSPFLVPRMLGPTLERMGVPTVGFYHADVVRTFAEPYVPSPWAAPLRVLARCAARHFVRRVYGGFDVTVAASRSVAEELVSLGVPRVRSVSLGVDLDLFRPRPSERSEWRPVWGMEGPARPVGLYVGRFCAEKRLDVLLDGHAQLPVAIRPTLVLVGGGPLEATLHERARRQEGLRVMPYESDRGRLARMYAAADFYLASGPGETFGLSIGEALASGLPVLCVGRGAGPDRLEGSDCGETYAHGRPASAADAMAHLVARLGPELRASARSHAEQTLSWDHTFQRLTELYLSLAARSVA